MKHKALGLSATAHGEFSRRDFMRSAAALGGAAMMGGLWSGTARAAGGALETTKAKLGFIALTDAAPLFVADEKGFFARHGMTEVEVLKQSSWGTTRDNLVLGSARNGIDGAHILVEISASVGQDIVKKLQRKRQIYIDATGVTPARFILAVGSIHSRRANALREAGFEVIEPEEDEIA